MNAHTPTIFTRAAPLHISVADKTFPPAAGRPAKTVLRDLVLDVEPRSFLVVTGPSGCGKSTLLNIVSGLDRNFTGTVAFDSTEPRLGFIFQSPRLLPWCTVEENIALVLPEADPRRAAIPELLTRVGLSGAETAYPERISLGMQRRVAIARAFVLEPEVLLMDEPFVSLDDPTADALRALVVDLWKRTPATVVFVTHDRAEAIRLATRIVRLRALTSADETSIVSDHPVTLTDAERLNPVALAAVRAEIFPAA